jgi:hypothetical protein
VGGHPLRNHVVVLDDQHLRHRDELSGVVSRYRWRQTGRQLTDPHIGHRSGARRAAIP